MRDAPTPSPQLRWPGLAALLFLLLLGWLSAGARMPWCLDNGLRRLAAQAPRIAEIQDLGAVANAAAPFDSTVFRESFPVVHPFIVWREGRPLSVFPPLSSLGLRALALPFGPEGAAPLWILLAGLALGAALWLHLAPEDLPPARRAGLALAGLASSPVLFYLGTVWETVPLAAGLLLLTRERRRPLPALLSPVYGLLPWLRPEALLLWAGGLFLLRGWPRRIGSGLGLLAGLGLQRALTGSWIPLQVVSNLADSCWQPLESVFALLLPAGGWPWILAGLGLTAGLAWALQRRSVRGEGLAWLAWAALLAVLIVFQWPGPGRLNLDQGLLVAAPLAAAALLGWRPRRDWERRGPETLLLAGFLLAVVLATPVARGFHWGPRLLVPALLPLGLQFLLDRPLRRSALPLGLALALQLTGLGLLEARRNLSRQQAVRLAECGPVVLTTEFSLLGDHPALAGERLVLMPEGEAPVQRTLVALQRAGVRELDLVARPGHPLTGYLSTVLQLPVSDPEFLPGGRLGRVLELRQVRLGSPPGRRPESGQRAAPVMPPGFRHP
jgi:hypothetical protein